MFLFLFLLCIRADENCCCLVHNTYIKKHLLFFFLPTLSFVATPLHLRLRMCWSWYTRSAMHRGRLLGVFCIMAVMGISTTFAALSPSGVNPEVVALWSIKTGLNDPHGVMENWDINSVDPCSWSMVTCSADASVTALGAPSQNLSGTLSAGIGNLSNLQSMLLQNNDIAGPLPEALGKLGKLLTLDLSNNHFSGVIPSSLGQLKNLKYLRMNNNSLYRPFPGLLANISVLSFLDLSYNNLSGSVPTIHAKTFSIKGNPLLCGSGAVQLCPGEAPAPMTFTANTSEPTTVPSGVSKKKHTVAVAFGTSLGFVCAIGFAIGILLWWRRLYRRISNLIPNADDGIHEISASFGSIGGRPTIRMASISHRVRSSFGGTAVAELRDYFLFWFQT